MRTLPLITLLFLLGNCSEEASVAVGKNPTRNLASARQQDMPEKADAKGSKTKKIDNIHYRVNILSARDFITRSGDHVRAEDEKELANEQVVLLEIALDNELKKIWEDPAVQMSQEDAMNYLVGGIATDFTIEQNGKTFSANGVNFEGRSGAVNKVKVQFFFAGINSEKPMKVLFYDRLTGAGLIKFGINE
jgi:hypothetical protein